MEDILKLADGLVFVTTMDPDRVNDSLEYKNEMLSQISTLFGESHVLPTVFLYIKNSHIKNTNKDEIELKLNTSQNPSFTIDSTSNDQVFESLLECGKQVIDLYDRT